MTAIEDTTQAESAARAALSPERADYPPIGAYGLVGDGRSCALVGRDGSIDWLCWPDFHSPSLFAALLDRRRGGRFRVGPVAPTRRIARRYLPETAVLETVFTTDEGVVRLLDFMAIRENVTLEPLRELVRIVEATEGAPEVGAVFAPRPDYAMRPAAIAGRSEIALSCTTGEGAAHLVTDFPLAPGEEGARTGRLRLDAGERRAFSLTFAGDDPAVLAPAEEADATLARTCAYWRGWSGRNAYRGRHREAVTRAAITLKLLTFAPSGALLAAATASLPEAVGGRLNWDYRYCWLRDAGLTLRAFSDLGYQEEATRFIDWLLHTTRLSAPELKPVYDVYGRLDLGERTLDHLEGYRGSRPVRVGNAARGQVQLDVYGTVVMAAFDFVERGGTLDTDARSYLAGFAEVVCRQWNEPDDGIWEVRGPRRRHTHSALMCWTALDRLIALADKGVLAIDRERAAATRAKIRNAIETQAFDPDMQAYSGLMDAPALDASLLVMARTHFHEPREPRLSRTHERLRRELGAGPLMRRYDARFDHPAQNEATFCICAFWEIEYLARRGEAVRAERQFEAMLGHANDLGLFAEETDAATGEARGNFPQAFTHAGLVNAALWIERARATGTEREAR